MIDPENKASIRTAEALGYVEYDQGSYRGKELVLLERTKP
jgi:hypothetical protein